MKALVVVGAQWGDEGKGKIVDLLTADVDVAVRYGGGPNAGHTVVVAGEKIVLHHVPSGVLGRKTHCVLGPGMVVDPEKLLAEMDALVKKGHLQPDRLLISDHAHAILPQHVEIDRLREERGGIGTTKRGIGPAYEDKVARRGVRLLDLCDGERLRARIDANLAAWHPVFVELGGKPPAGADVARRYAAFGERLRPYLGDASLFVEEALQGGKNVLFEGAQGTLLDIDHGTYPFVTSSSAVAGGACTGTGIGPTRIGAVLGVTKAYATRVGDGPFPTQAPEPIGARLREAGGEFGATTGRPRRCGWLDVPALRLAARINGLTSLAVTKLDVLSGLPKIPIAVAYDLGGKRLDVLPIDRLADARPVLEEAEGWTERLGGARSLADLPAAARAYVRRIESLVGVPVALVSVGSDRDETIRLRDSL